jgi:hypothetical protein
MPIIGAVVLIGIVVVGVVLVSKDSTPKKAPVTTADAQSTYVRLVRANATGSVITAAPDANLLGLGQGVCRELPVLGAPRTSQRMLTPAKDGFDAHDAAVVIVAAADTICTQNMPLVAKWNGAPATGPVNP